MISRRCDLWWYSVLATMSFVLKVVWKGYVRPWWPSWVVFLLDKYSLVIDILIIKLILHCWMSKKLLAATSRTFRIPIELCRCVIAFIIYLFSFMYSRQVQRCFQNSRASFYCNQPTTTISLRVKNEKKVGLIWSMSLSISLRDTAMLFNYVTHALH